MKLLKYLLIIFVVSFTNMNAQDNNIVGKTNKKVLQSNPEYKWFEENYNSYNTNPELVRQIKDLLHNNNFTIEVYFGTWCSDSQREVPSLIKILDQANFKYGRLTMIGVDEDKVVPDVSEEKRQKLDIHYVPTIIIYKDGVELNRYVEYARETLEQDLIKILSKKPYKHSYL